MGESSEQKPHVKRSSSISFALRWKHENMRNFTFLIMFTLTVTTMFFMLLNSTSAKSIALVDDGQVEIISTKHTTVQQVLDEKAVQVGEFDQISMALDNKLKEGDRIEIVRAVAVKLKADGETRTVHTLKKTVGDALEEINLSLKKDDKITPALTEPLADNTEIEIVRVTKEQKEEALPIAFEVKTQKDANLLKGKEQTLQEGKEGQKVITKERVYEDGVLISEQVVSEKIAMESKNKIIAVGTKNPVVTLAAKPAAAKKASDQTTNATTQTVTKNGVDISYKKILNNVTLTAYSAHVESTGKNPGDKGFGITSSGAKVTEGRTIAVDTSVIPLGWWVYIEGIGYRRAEDTGSAVKGNKIDVYYDSEAYAQKFGLKRGYTVYVIGPKNPTVD